MTQPAVIEGTTQHARQWSATAHTPDLMTVFTDAIDAVREGHQTPPRPVDPDAAVGFDAAYAWAMRQDFDDDYAARVRREAWSRRDTR